MRGSFKIDRELSDELKSAATTGPEVCGYIVKTENGIEPTYRYFNGNGRPEQFMLGAKDYIAAKDRGEIVGIWHTHPDDSGPSEQDVKLSHAMNLPVLVVTAHSKDILTADPYPLMGHQFEWGVEDCLTTVTRFYGRHRIWIPHYVRQGGEFGTHQGLFLENFERVGFVRLPEGSKTRQLDGMVVQFGTKFFGHAIAFETDRRIVHHIPKRLSTRQDFPHYFLNRSVHLRHKKFL